LSGGQSPSVGFARRENEKKMEGSWINPHAVTPISKQTEPEGGAKGFRRGPMHRHEELDVAGPGPKTHIGVRGRGLGKPQT